MLLLAASNITKLTRGRNRESTGGVGLMKAPFGGGAPIQWGGEGADYFYPTMFDI